MRTKKRVAITRFNNFENNSKEILTESFYNYKPSVVLNNSSGIAEAIFPNGGTNLNNYIYINSEAGIGRLYDCFLYDGEDLYVFTENTSIVVDEVKYDLSPMSFVEASNGYIRIYNKKKNEFVFIEKYKSAKAYTEEYFINLLDDSFTYNNSYYMLIKNVDKLDLYEF